MLRGLHGSRSILFIIEAVTCARSVPVIVNRIAPGMGESVWFMTLL